MSARRFSDMRQERTWSAYKVLSLNPKDKDHLRYIRMSALEERYVSMLVRKLVLSVMSSWHTYLGHECMLT
jgi:hypothetical protein